MRTIFLPNLEYIKIQNYTLYPKGLDFEYNFINGVNLILGGNGMGKTTFVNIIKYAIIGNYKKGFDYTRTYQERKIEKRAQNPPGYFKNRMDATLQMEQKATVTIEFKINDSTFLVERNLEDITLNSFSINENFFDGKVISQHKYEDLREEQKKDYLQSKYEKEIENHSGLSFDDLIFFVNEILFFGEDHKTILWNDGLFTVDVQNELFNKYFNSPELDKERQEAVRQAKYFDSLSRHRSEDIRAIKKVLEKTNYPNNKNINHDILLIKEQIEDITEKINKIQEDRINIDNKISIFQNKRNRYSIEFNDLETQKKMAENKLYRKVWEKLHPKYDIFLKNITNNHKCPMCNKPNAIYAQKIISTPNNCFVCGSQLDKTQDEELNMELKKASEICTQIYTEIKQAQIEIQKLEEENKDNDRLFRDLEVKKRKLQVLLRDHEFSQSKDNKIDQLQAFYDEIDTLDKQKNEYLELSRKEKDRANNISKKIEEHIIQNTKYFSNFFSSFAGQFLNVPCELTYDQYEGESKRFYPVIDGKIRYSEDELSESQRFFVDHSFRMSILSFFYTTPSFYIVETPDSSLDISYERNAADVFLQFLGKPNSLIITSNLNNNSFINYIVDNKKNIEVSIIGLLDIAKQSIIQNTSETLLIIYNQIKDKLNTKKQNGYQ